MYRGSWPWPKRLGLTQARFFFVGGAVVNLYTTPSGTPEPRITDDVDCIVEVTPRTAFYQLEEELRTLGFVNDVASGVTYQEAVHQRLRELTIEN